jgi:quercetin dioxygenase-like cupin family protein
MPTSLPVLRLEDTLAQVQWDDERGKLSFKTLIDGDQTPTTSLTLGTATLPPGGHLALHRHAQPEIYYVLSGTGDVTIDGVRHTVQSGASIFIPGNAEHGLENTGPGPMKFLYAFAADRFSDVVYVFS